MREEAFFGGYTKSMFELWASRCGAHWKCNALVGRFDFSFVSLVVLWIARYDHFRPIWHFSVNLARQCASRNFHVF